MQKVELLRSIAHSPQILSPSTVVLSVLEKASQPDCMIGDLWQIIQRDPSLADELIRMLNSATAGLPHAVTSIEQAFTVVGINSTRSLVLTVSFPEMHKALKPDPISRQSYWRGSIAGAVVAKELAVRAGSRDTEDDMTAALVRDIGELILQQLFPEAFCELSAQPDDEYVQHQCEMEEGLFNLNHAEVSAYILDRWRLPTAITEAIRHHHHPDQGSYSSPQAEDRAFLLYFATRAAQLLTFPDQPVILRELLDLARTHYGMNELDLHEFLAPLSKKTCDLAALLQVDVGDPIDFLSVLGHAGEELVNLTMSANLDDQRATESTRRAECEARSWKGEAAYDPLTRLFNRRFLKTRMQELFTRIAANGSGFGLVFLDLDGFKSLNDKFGHLFGDYALQQVADCLNRVVRQGDIVARCGGDEFCIVSNAMEEEGVRSLGNRVWKEINQLVIRQNGNEGKIVASIGAVHCDARRRWASSEECLGFAEKAMYRAKRHGKNRVVFLGSLMGKEDSQVLFV